MNQALKWVYLVTLITWIGSIIFSSFVVAPTVFAPNLLKPEDQGAVIRRIFSKYYMIGMVGSVVGIVAVGLLVANRAFGKWPGVATLLLLAMMGGVDLWLRQAVMPHMNELRDHRAALVARGEPPSPELDSEWASLHRLSVQLNGAVLLSGLVLVFLVVYARVA